MSRQLKDPDLFDEDDELRGPTDTELEELEREGLDRIIEDPSFESTSDRLDELFEKVDEISLKIDSIEKMVTDIWKRK